MSTPSPFTHFAPISTPPRAPDADPPPSAAIAAAALSELLRKEADHRISNSLQLLSGLLSMQQQYVMDAQARDALARTSKRLRLIAQIHRRLSVGDGTGVVSLEEYLMGLRDEIYAAVVDHHRHDLLFNVDPVQVPVKIASAAGMIINEFIFNSIKHAFPAQDAGTIEVACGQGPDGALYLRISDDGIGLPPHVQPDAPTGLGMTLMQGLVAQLQGHFSVRRQPRGACYEIMFPLEAA